MPRKLSKSVDEKFRVVLSVLSGESSIAAAARGCGVSEPSVARWRDLFLEGGKAGLSEGGGLSGRESVLEAENEQLKAALGEAYVALRVFRKKGVISQI